MIKTLKNLSKQNYQPEGLYVGAKVKIETKKNHLLYLNGKVGYIRHINDVGVSIQLTNTTGTIVDISDLVRV